MKKYHLMLLCCMVLLTACSPNDNQQENINHIKDTQEEKIYSPKDELSDDIRSFQVQLNDSVCQFPMTYQQFEKNGWKVYEKYASEGDMLEAKLTTIVRFYNGNDQIDCYVFNPDNTIQPYCNCVISGIIADFRFEAKNANIFIPSGLKLGTATMTDVEIELGKPDDQYIGSGTTQFTYETDNVWAGINLTFNENDILIKYSSENPIAPDDFVYSEAVDINTGYVAPTELGKSIEDRIINVAGDLYAMPAPLSAFFDNGWSTDNVDEVVSANDIIHLNIERGNVECQITLHNYFDTACTASDAFVEHISSLDVYGEEFSVSGGINMNTTEDQLLSILKNNNYQYEVEEGLEGNHYTIKLEGKEWSDYCSITFKGESVGYIVFESTKQ